MVLDFERLKDISIDDDGIKYTLSSGDTVYVYMNRQEKELLKDRLIEAKV